MVSVIAIAGLPGSGKSVLCRALCALPQFQRWEFKSTGGLLRERHGYLQSTGYEGDFIQYLNNLSDKEIILLNNNVRNLAIKGEMILDSRFAVENTRGIDNTLTIFLKASLDVRVHRQIKSNPSRSLEEAKQDLEKRELWELNTGEKLYGYDYRDEHSYDLVLDTSKMTLEEEVQKILAAIN